MSSVSPCHAEQTADPRSLRARHKVTPRQLPFLRRHQCTSPERGQQVQKRKYFIKIHTGAVHERGAEEPASIHTKLSGPAGLLTGPAGPLQFPHGCPKDVKSTLALQAERLSLQSMFFCFLTARCYKQLRCLYLPKTAGRNKAGHSRVMQPPHLSLKTSFTFAIFTCVGYDTWKTKRIEKHYREREDVLTNEGLPPLPGTASML